MKTTRKINWSLHNILNKWWKTDWHKKKIRRKKFRVKSRLGQKLLNFNKMMKKCFFRENNYQQVYLLFFSSNFLNFCAPTLRFGNKTGGLKNIIRWTRTQFLWKSRFFEFFPFNFFQKETFTSEFCFFLKKSSYLIYLLVLKKAKSDRNNKIGHFWPKIYFDSINHEKIAKMGRKKGKFYKFIFFLSENTKIQNSWFVNIRRHQIVFCWSSIQPHRRKSTGLRLLSK